VCRPGPASRGDVTGGRDQPTRRPAWPTTQIVVNALRLGLLGSACAYGRSPAPPGMGRQLAGRGRSRWAHRDRACGIPAHQAPIQRPASGGCARLSLKFKGTAIAIRCTFMASSLVVYMLADTM